MAPSNPKPGQQTIKNAIYDTWVSHSTGHQVADNPYSNTTAWRDTRAQKLRNQFRAGDCLAQSPRAQEREQRAETGAGAGAGAGAFDGTLGPDSPETDAHQPSSRSRAGGEYRWVSDAEAKRSQMGLRDIRGFMGVNKRKADDQVHGTEKKLKWVHSAEGRMERQRDIRGDVSTGRLGEGMALRGNSESSSTSSVSTPSASTRSTSASAPAPASVSMPAFAPVLSKTKLEPTPEPPSRQPTPKDENENENQAQPSNANPNPNPKSKSKSTLLTGTSIYINGTTLPQISDHKLKHLLVAHGANIASFMARKGVTHIIAAQPGTTGSGAGGGLAARKLHTEISRAGWKGIKVVGVEWALESIKAGKRLAESRFSVLNIAPKGQRSVVSFFGA